MKLSFVKCHGSGNAFPLVDGRGVDFDDATWARVARALADRDGPVGGDGVLVFDDRVDAPARFSMQMRNSDGSEAETCLNGLRLVARMGFETLGIDAATVRLKTSRATVARDADLAAGVYTVRETAGPAALDVAAWPMTVGTETLVEAVMPALSPTLRFTAVAIPNPHLIAFVESIDEADLVRVGMLCEAAPAWLPNRANVSFVEVRAPDAIFVRTHERGVGLTDSCGSAMASSTYAACLTGRCGWGADVTVFNAGGLVRARAERDAMVTLSGNATWEWAGTIAVDPATGALGEMVVERRFPAEVAAWEAVRALAG